jgi:glycosyltransferase involved in cell wall biosynthesis
LIAFVIPGWLDTPTGGYIYDRRIIEGMRAAGVHVDVTRLAASFPFPDQKALRHAARKLGSIPDGTVVVVDGLAGGAMPVNIAREKDRLRIVALVHHPLARETGLTADKALALEVSERQTLESVRHVVVTSRATAKLLTENFGLASTKVTVVEPGTDPAIRAVGSPDAWLELLCVASVTPRKGHVTLMRALGQLHDLDWHLTCVGSLHRDAAAGRAVEHAAGAAKIRDRVTFTGELIDTADLAPYYDAADVFVLPTEYEGYGMAVAEALARGLPVISTPTGGIGDLVGTDAGILVAPGDADALARALRRVLTDETERKRLREGAWRVGSRLPTWEHAAKQMAAVLAKV